MKIACHEGFADCDGKPQNGCEKPFCECNDCADAGSDTTAVRASVTSAARAIATLSAAGLHARPAPARRAESAAAAPMAPGITAAAARSAAR